MTLEIRRCAVGQAEDQIANACSMVLCEMQFTTVGQSQFKTAMGQLVHPIECECLTRIRVVLRSQMQHDLPIGLQIHMEQFHCMEFTFGRRCGGQLTAQSAQTWIEHPDGVFAHVSMDASTASAAARVASMSASVWADDIKPASNAEGAR